MKIGILGDGVTARAVKNKLEQLEAFEYTANLNIAELIVASPGIPPEQYPQVNVEIISEIEFAYRLFQRKEATYTPKIMAITGTNGKSTVTSLIAHILKIPFCGNIGVPLINYVDSPDKPKWLSLELSSYQLEACSTFTADIAILLNITPDHLLRHKTMERYAVAKAAICNNHTDKQFFIYNKDDEFVAQIAKKTGSTLVPFSSNDQDLTLLNNLKIKGQHNQLNALAALYAVRLTGMKDQKIIKRINSYQALEHRLEFVLTYKNIEIYNDSKATNPDSTRIAVQAFHKPINIIIGGKDKELNLKSFIEFLVLHTRSITIFGEIADRFYAELKELDNNFMIYKVENITQAIQQVMAISSPGEIVLFSPACSSFDQFTNFEERGQIFKSLIKEYYGEAFN